jgi:hypothetical protein
MPGQSDDSTLFAKIASFSERYRDEHLAAYDSTTLVSDWWKALDFFLSRAFFQGRLDKVSQRVYETGMEVLNEAFEPYSGAAEQRFATLQHVGWNQVEKGLSRRIGRGHVGKKRDIEMVLSTLDFLVRIPERNIVAYSVAKIRSNQIEPHFRELQAARSSSGIRQVGPKVAAFYLRDVVFLFRLEDQIPVHFAFCLQPVDVWVRRLTVLLGLANSKASDQRLAQAIVATCGGLGVSPLRFNQGAWYIGAHSFDLIVEKLREAR